MRYLLPMLESLRQSDFDILPSLGAAGLSVEPSGNGWVDLNQLTTLVSELEALTQRTDLGFEVGLTIGPSSHGPVGDAMFACRDIDQVLTLLAHSMHLMNRMYSVRYTRPNRNGTGLFLYTPVLPLPPRVQAFLWDLSAAAFFNHTQLLLPDVPPTYEATISMPVPAHHARYAELAPTRTRFDPAGLPGIVLSIPAQILDAPLPTHSERVFANIIANVPFLSGHVTPSSGGAPWGDYIATMLQQIEGPHPTLGELAQRLGISTRTIDRHLAAEGLSYRELARAQMIARAGRLLMQPGASVTSVAEQLGFSDAFSFSHAFRRGTGMAPSKLQQAGSAPPPASPRPSPAPAKPRAAPAKRSPR